MTTNFWVEIQSFDSSENGCWRTLCIGGVQVKGVAINPAVSDKLHCIGTHTKLSLNYNHTNSATPHIVFYICQRFVFPKMYYTISL